MTDEQRFRIIGDTSTAESFIPSASPRDSVEADRAGGGVTPIRRGTAKRLGLRLPPTPHYLVVTPDISAFVAGIRHMQEQLKASGFAFSFKDFGGAR